LTKSDLVFPDILAKRIQIINEEIEKFKSTVPDVLLVSGKEKSGIVEIQKVMCTLMDQARLRDLQSKIQKREEKNSVVKANQLLL
jgi:flagellar basal body rod protein FlgF